MVDWKLIDPGPNGRDIIRTAIAKVLCSNRDASPMCPRLAEEGIACRECGPEAEQILQAIEANAVLGVWMGSRPGEAVEGEVEVRRSHAFRQGDTINGHEEAEPLRKALKSIDFKAEAAMCGTNPSTYFRALRETRKLACDVGCKGGLTDPS